MWWNYQNTIKNANLRNRTASPDTRFFWLTNILHPVVSKCRRGWPISLQPNSQNTHHTISWQNWFYYLCKYVWISTPLHAGRWLRVPGRAFALHNSTICQMHEKLSHTKAPYFLQNSSHENPNQRREAIFSSSTRNRKPTMAARIRSREGFAEHVGSILGRSFSIPSHIFSLFAF